MAEKLHDKELVSFKEMMMALSSTSRKDRFRPNTPWEKILTPRRDKRMRTASKLLERPTPCISINALVDYMVGRPSGQPRVLKAQKRPKSFVNATCARSEDAIARHVATCGQYREILFAAEKTFSTVHLNGGGGFDGRLREGRDWGFVLCPKRIIR
ncbi:MAG: hypothetical protein JW836_14600 [Deltaproteobacteria bacterium]|nr:hypothetical protein [Deltaproteobacteria bacterium]